MKKRVLKSILCLSLSAAMILGEAGLVFAEPTESVTEEVVEATQEETTEETETEEAEAQETAETPETVEASAEEEDSIDAVGEKIVSAYNLADVAGLAYDAATGVLSWNKVANADWYEIEVYNAENKQIMSRTTSNVYWNVLDYDDDGDYYFAKDTAYTFKVTAKNDSELYLVAADVAGYYDCRYDAASGKDVEGIWSYDSATGTYKLLYKEGVDYDTYTYKQSQTTDGTTVTSYTLYKAPASVNQASISAVVRTSTDKSVTALTGITVKETTDDGVTFSFVPDTLQKGERIEYTYANNAAYKSDAGENLYAYSSSIGSSNGSIGTLYVDFSDFMSGDTIYVKAHVYNPNYDYTAVQGQTSENRKSADVTTTYKVPAGVMNYVALTVTKDSIRLEPYGTGTITGYQYQRKNGKTWVTLAQQGDNYTDKGLKADTKYTYRVRGYIYNSATKKTSYTDWKTVNATTWGTSLNLKASAASSTSVKLAWSKVSGASGYEIYRVDTSSSAYNVKNGESSEVFNNKTLVKTIKKAKTVKYTDKKLTKGNTYEYMVRAFRTVGKTKYYIDDYATVTLSAKGMRLISQYYNAKGQYVVKWNKMTGISGYKVEKYDNTKGKYVDYKKLKSSATSYTFPKVSAGAEEVEYRIRPYKGSKFYNGTSVSVEPNLAAVSSVKAVQTAEGIQVSWKAVAGADYYEVYRAKQDSAVYNSTTKTYNLGSGAELVYETNYEDTSAGVNLVPVKKDMVTPSVKITVPSTSVTYEDGVYYYTDAQGVKHALNRSWEWENGNCVYYYYGPGTQSHPEYQYDISLSNALYGARFYNDTTSYRTSEIKGTSVVDKTVTVTSLVDKTDDPAYDKNNDSEYVKENGWYTGNYGRYQKNADGSLKTKTVTMNKGPQAGTEYYYFVIAYAKPSNGAGENSTTAESIGYSKSAKVVYTKVSAKATKISSAKSSKKATATIKIKKASGAKGYAVYRSTKKNGTYVQIGTTTKTSYTDNNVTGGKTYYYKVASYKTSENGTYVYSKLSSAKKVKIKK